MAGERDWGFRRLDIQIARRNFAEWISDSERRRWFRRVVAERGGPSARSLDASPESLGPLGAWLLEALRAEARVAVAPGIMARLFGRQRVRPEAPPWAGAGVSAPFDALSDESLRLIEEVAWYLTECYRARFPHSRCTLDTDAASPTLHDPLVIGPGEEVVAAPVRMVLETLEPLVRSDASAQDWLAELLESWSARVPEVLREPPRGTEWAYEQLSREEAKAHFARHVATEEERLDAFRDLVERLGGPLSADLDLSRDSLGPLGRWMLDAVVDGPRDGEIPLWARPMHQLTLSGDSIRLMDGAAAYFAAALHRRHPDLRWKLTTMKLDINYHAPVLGGLLSPVRPMFGGLERGRSADPPDGDWILRLFDVWDEGFGAADASADGKEPSADDVEVSRTEMPGYDVEIWIPEYVEQLIGSEAFDALQEQFAAISGVRELVWEDRELFFAKLQRGTKLTTLTDRIKAVLREAQAQAAASTDEDASRP